MDEAWERQLSRRSSGSNAWKGERCGTFGVVTEICDNVLGRRKEGERGCRARSSPVLGRPTPQTKCRPTPMSHGEKSRKMMLIPLFFFSPPPPMAYGSFQAMDQIHTRAVTYTEAATMPDPQHTALGQGLNQHLCRDKPGHSPTAPQPELQGAPFFFSKEDN